MKLWREEDPEIDEYGEIVKGGMFQHQRDWWHMDNFVKALIAGYGAGKTLIGSKRAVAVALHNAPAPYLCVSPTYKMAKRTLIPTISALLNGKQSLHRNFWWKFNKSDHEFKIRFRGREAIIWVASGEDPQSLKGPNVGAGLIDEPFIQKEEVLNQMIARIRDRNAKIQELGLTGTPEQLNWGYDICEGDRQDDYDVGIVHANTALNRTLGDEYHQRLLASLTPEAAQAYVEGKFVNLTRGRIYYGFDRHRNVARLEDPMGELGVGMDFNVNPMAAIVFWVKGDHMHIVREIELPNADTYSMCDTIQNIVYPSGHPYAGNRRVRTIFPDASGNHRTTNSPGGKSDFKIIEKDFGFTIDAPPANPAIRDRENSVNGKFNPVSGRPTLTVDPSCTKLIGYFEKHTAEERNTKEGKERSHLLDATGYPIHRLFPVHRPAVVKTNLIGT